MDGFGQRAQESMDGFGQDCIDETTTTWQDCIDETTTTTWQDCIDETTTTTWQDCIDETTTTTCRCPGFGVVVLALTVLPFAAFAKFGHRLGRRPDNHRVAPGAAARELTD